MQRYVDMLDRYKYPFLVLLTLAVALLSLSLKHLAFEGNYKIWFEKDAPIIREYERFRTVFSGDDSFVVAFEDPKGIFTPGAVSVIRELAERFAGLEGVRKVDALTNYQYISADGDDLTVEDFIYGDENLSAKKRIALKDPLILHHMISEDGTTTMLAVHLDSRIGADEELNIRLFGKLGQITREVEARTGYRFYITGIPAVTASLVTVATEDMLRLLPAAVVLVTLVLFALFRNLLGILVPVSVVVYTFLTVLSIQMLLGYKLNNFTANTPSFITAISVADAMHLYLAWIYYKHKRMTTKAALVCALRTNIFPIALTSLTTAVGFASLAFSAIEPVATLGLAISSGALIAFLLSVSLAPAIILTRRPDADPGEVRFLNLVHVRGYGAFIVRHDRAIVGGFAVVFLVAAAGAALLKIDSNSVKYFAKETTVRSGAEFLEKKLTGSMRYEVVIDSKAKDGIKESAFLREVQRFDDYLKTHFPAVRHTYSIEDIVERMQRVVNPEANETLPSDRNLTAQYLLLYSMSLPQGMEINDRIDTGERYLRFTVSTDMVNSSEDLAMIEKIKAYWAKTPYSATVQGQTAIFARMQKDLTATLIVSIAVTVLLVSVLMLLIFRRVSMGWIFIVPNIAPLVFVGGFMGYTGIVADIGVAISAAVILGIAVDDTIHFFTKYFESIGKRGFEETIDYIVSHSGNAMILTTVLLSVTFSVFALSRFQPNVSFAVVTVVALNIALAFDLVLLPALLSRRYKRLKGAG